MLYSSTMKITEALFAKSVFRKEELPEEEFPEVAFAGRSNVGKSSLINTLLNRDNLARTGGTPGTTVSINFFFVNGNCFFVDFPGYGYAKRSKSMQSAWGNLLKEYLLNRRALRAVVQLVDIRHPGEIDRNLRAQIRALRIPAIVVLTKVDKLTCRQQQRQEGEIARLFRIDKSYEHLIPFSSKTGEGRAKLLDVIRQHLFD